MYITIRLLGVIGQVHTLQLERGGSTSLCSEHCSWSSVIQCTAIVPPVGEGLLPRVNVSGTQSGFQLDLSL